MSTCILRYAAFSFAFYNHARSFYSITLLLINIQMDIYLIGLYRIYNFLYSTFVVCKSDARLYVGPIVPYDIVVV